MKLRAGVGEVILTSDLSGDLIIVVQDDDWETTHVFNVANASATKLKNTIMSFIERD